MDRVSKQRGTNKGDTIESLDDGDKDDVSVLATTIQDKLMALLVKARKQSSSSVGSQVASGSDKPPGSGLTAVHPQANTGGQQSTPIGGTHLGTTGTEVDGSASSGPDGK